MNRNNINSASGSIPKITIPQLRVSGRFNETDAASIEGRVLQQLETNGSSLNPALQKKVSRELARQIQNAVQAKMPSNGEDRQ